VPTVVNIRPIPELVEYFVQHFAASMEKTIETISEQTMHGLVRHA
jgi:transcriptional regulator with PAS, ATPase and Fis domain